MKRFTAALWGEWLKARRSKVLPFSAGAFAFFPLVSGLFMIILRDLDAAKHMGLISAKSQLVAGAADWPSYWDVLMQASALGGAIIFGFVVAWVFGREGLDRTIKELVATPTPREVIVGAKVALLIGWMAALTCMVAALSLVVGALVRISGWSPELALSAIGRLAAISGLNLLLTFWVAYIASRTSGVLAAAGWAVGSVIVAQIVSVLGWGDVVPWSVPVLLSGMFGEPGIAQLGVHSYALVALVGLAGVAAALAWWRDADHHR